MIVWTVRMVAAGLVLVAPGSWLILAGGLSAYSLRARLALAVTATPLVLVAEFYLLRSSSLLSFERTSAAIALVNLPALWLLLRSAGGPTVPRLGSSVVWAPFVLLPAGYLWYWISDPVIRATWGHALLHADIVYMLANGQLWPEDPQMAGLRLAYPWIGHVVQAVVSEVAGSAPTTSYMMTNSVWLLAALACVAELVALLGGDRLAQAFASAWLCFGLNFVGNLGGPFLPGASVQGLPVWGDPRYTPWMRKFGAFEQTMFGMVLFAAVLVLLARHVDEETPRAPAVPLVALLVSSALIYPILFPVTAALAVGYVLTVAARAFPRLEARGKELLGVSAAVLLSAAVLAISLSYVTIDRAGGATMGLSDMHGIRVKTFRSLVVLSPLLAGCLVGARAVWRTRPGLLALLASGVAASLLLHALADIYYEANEYKFMFTAALCLAPFPPLALARAGRARGPAALAWSVACALVLAAPAVYRISRQRPDMSAGPQVDGRTFDLTLDSSDPLAAMLPAIRTTTPMNAVLVSRWEPYDLVAFARRPIYVPVDSSDLLGLGMAPDYLLTNVRGYATELVGERRRRVTTLYEGDTPEDRAQALDEIGRDVGRPLVVLVRRVDNPGLVAWIEQRSDTRVVYADADVAAYLVAPPTP